MSGRGRRLYGRFDVWYERRKALIQIVMGLYLIVVSLVLVVIAVETHEGQEREAMRDRQERALQVALNHRQAAELAQAKVACERTRQFGPVLLAFFRDVEGRLHLRDVTPAQLVQYGATIPKHC